MLNNVGDIKNEVLVRLNASTTLAYYTDTILNDWLNDAHRWAAGYHEWPFIEGKVDTTFVTGTETYSYPENWKPDSIRYLEVGGKRFQKTNFYDYKIYREDNSSGQDKIFSDFAFQYYINPQASVSGTISVYGRYMPTQIDTSDNTNTTTFSNIEEEGNEAMVNEMLSFAMLREKKTQEANFYHQRAQAILEELWNRYKDEQSGYLAKNHEFFKRLDVLRGATRDELIKRDQFF